MISPLTGKLKEDTTYAIPIAEMQTLDVKGRRNVEVMRVTYEAGTHIEDVRRSMNSFVSEHFTNISNEAFFIHMGFYELLPSAVYMQMVEVSNRMRLK